MIPKAWREGEVAVVGLARSGLAAARWLAAQGLRVYASDASDSPTVHEAASALTGLGVATEVGRHDLPRIARAAAVIVSPGVPPTAPPLVAARDAGREVVAELDLGARALPRTRLIVITGTLGKSTTTALTAHLLAGAGIEAPAAGNIGRPLIAIALQPSAPPWVVVEASSFQLHDARHLVPAIGMVTNLSPNHLDRYTSVDEYYGDKQLLFRNATAESFWILNGDDAAVAALAAGVPGRRRQWSMRGRADACYDGARRQLMLDGAPLLARDALPLVGAHNVENALAAILASQAAGATREAVATGLTTFRPLPHRLEPVRETADGVLWINDSKATSVTSAATAVRAMERPFVVILGGRHKGQPYIGLADLLDTVRCRGVVAYGEAAPRIVADLPRAHRVNTLADAVAEAKRLARPGDAVLLAPGCSSYDQFRDYEERGEAFRHLVEQL